MKAKHFFNFARDETTGVRELFIEGDIADSVWFGDECTPGQFRKELFGGTGDITLWINSNGGDCIAASQIYTMLMEYPGEVTVKIHGMTASAASVIAMAGTKVMMSPTAMMFIHNPWTFAVGDRAELEKVGVLLDEVKESILNAYEIKTGLSRTKLSHLMDNETPMSVHTAIALGFCDGIITDKKKQGDSPLANKSSEVMPLGKNEHSESSPQDGKSEEPKTENKITIESLTERLNLIIGGISNV